MDKQDKCVEKESKSASKISKPNFSWDDDKVAEVSRLVWEHRNSSEIWTEDLTAELVIIRKYKIEKALSYLKADLIISNIDNNTNNVIVDGKKLNELIKYLTNYQAELHGAFIGQ